MKVTRSSAIVPETDVTVAGWVHELRDLGGISFLLLRDRDGIMQITIPKKKVPLELVECVRSLSRESVVRVEGHVKAEPKAPQGYEIIPYKVELLSAAESPLPLDVTGKVPAELDTRLDARFMDVRLPATRAIFFIRAAVLNEVRAFLVARDFIEIQTPKMVATATEGGTQLFPISYFDREAFLNQSPQLYKQIMMAAGLERVFEVGPIFRAEEHDTRKHLNEVTSIDVEASFMDDREVMGLLEELIRHVYVAVAERCSAQLQALGVTLSVPHTPFRRITYAEAIEIADIPWGDDLDTAAERAVGEEIGEHYFIVDWPVELKPFYVQPRNNLCYAFDLMHPRMELASGARRIHDYRLLSEQLANKSLASESFAFYLDAFRYGMPPHAGWGLGAERLLVTMLGLANIRESVLFPRDRRRITP
ncbi:MAG: aspartate--tRNA(Asn) ligase [Halobacteriota archaeon]|jgi:aspartyl-tRNA synthetase